MPLHIDGQEVHIGEFGMNQFNKADVENAFNSFGNEKIVFNKKGSELKGILHEKKRQLEDAKSMHENKMAILREDMGERKSGSREGEVDNVENNISYELTDDSVENATEEEKLAIQTYRKCAYKCLAICKDLKVVNTMIKHLEDSKSYKVNLQQMNTIEKAEQFFMKASEASQAKVEKVMRDFKEGKLKDSDGNRVSDRKQAIAIAMSEAGLDDGDIEKFYPTGEPSQSRNNAAATDTLTKKREMEKSDDMNKAFDDLFEKANYKNNAENRRLGRVGKHYGGKKSTQSKRDKWVADGYKKVKSGMPSLNEYQKDGKFIFTAKDSGEKMGGGKTSITQDEKIDIAQKAMYKYNNRNNPKKIVKELSGDKKTGAKDKNSGLLLGRKIKELDDVNSMSDRDWHLVEREIWKFSDEVKKHLPKELHSQLEDVETGDWIYWVEDYVNKPTDKAKEERSTLAKEFAEMIKDEQSDKKTGANNVENVENVENELSSMLKNKGRGQHGEDLSRVDVKKVSKWMSEFIEESEGESPKEIADNIFDMISDDGWEEYYGKKSKKISKAFDDLLEKGIYKNNAENRKEGRVGRKYGGMTDGERKRVQAESKRVREKRESGWGKMSDGDRKRVQAETKRVREEKQGNARAYREGAKPDVSKSEIKSVLKHRDFLQKQVNKEEAKLSKIKDESIKKEVKQGISQTKRMIKDANEELNYYEKKGHLKYYGLKKGVDKDDSLEKGIYVNNSENRKEGRVGKQYGGAKEKQAEARSNRTGGKQNELNEIEKLKKEHEESIRILNLRKRLLSRTSEQAQRDLEASYGKVKASSKDKEKQGNARAYREGDGGYSKEAIAQKKEYEKPTKYDLSAKHKDLIQEMGDATERKLKNNTSLKKIGSDIAVKLYDTNIATFKNDGGVKLNSGGWMTKTTKDRINSFIDGSVYQKNKEWYVDHKGKTYHWQDGITLYPSGKVVGGSELEN